MLANRGKAVLLAIVAAAFVSLFAGGSAAAQPDEEAGGVRGALTYNTVDEEDIPLEGAEIIVYEGELSPDGRTIVDVGAEVGRATADAEGAWEVRLPTPGDYVVELNLESLPEGVELVSGDGERPVRLSPNQMRPQLFRLAGEEAAAAARVTTGDPLWERVLRQSVQGLKFGLIIGMSAIGLSLIYGTTGLVNFAHSEMITFGAVVAWFINSKIGIHLLIAAPIAMLLGGLAGVGLDVGLWRPLRRRATGLIAMMIVSIGLAITVRYAILYVFRDRRRPFENYAVQFDTLFTLGPIEMIPKDAVMIVVSAASLVAVGVVLRYTKLGKAMRAVSDNPDLAASTGIDVNRVITGVWFTAGVLVTLGGIFVGLSEQIQWLTGFNLLLLVFAAVILGGLGTTFGVMFGGLVIGLFIEVIPVFYPPGWNDPLVSPELKNIGALAAMIVILMIRPQGLFGRKERIG
jgi:neutral amino acid transport system permease protein